MSAASFLISTVVWGLLILGFTFGALAAAFLGVLEAETIMVTAIVGWTVLLLVSFIMLWTEK